MYSYKSSKSSLIKLLRRILASFIAGVFLVNTLFFDIAIAQPSVSTLAPLAASENPKVKREITAAMFRASRLIWLANSPRYLDLLSRYSALALLLPSGRYLMTPETAANDLTLIRSAAHEDNEVLMQQEEKLHATRYNKLMRQILDRDDIMKLYYVLSHYKEPTKQPNNIVFNDLISKAFEILFILDEGLVYPDELKPEEREFIVLMRPILQAKDSLGRYKNFSQVFFDTDKRTKAIKALQENKDERFYRVANSVLADNSPPEDLQKRLLSATEILLPMLKVVDIEKVRGPPDVLSKMKSILIQSGQEVDVQRFSHLLKVKPIPDEIIFFIDNKCLLVRKNELQDAMKNLDMADLQQIILSLGAYINLWENNTILDEADNILLSAKSSIQSGQVVNQFAVAFQRPLLIGNVKIPSRFCIQAMNGNDSVDGLPSERTLRRYEEYGRSGAGLIISESSGIGETWRTNNLIVNRDHAQGVNNIVAAVKRENPTAVLLFQIGYKCPTPASVAIFDPHFARLEGKEPLHETLTREEIRSIINSYIDAAEVVYDSGGDGVELKACHMSLLMNFLMPSNHRQDEYGGTLNNRMRIVLEIINGIRKRIPDTRFKIGVRLSMYEGLSYPGGMGTVNHLSASEDISESCAMLAAFADAGAELLNISAGNAVLTPDVMSPTEMPSNFSLANLEGFPLFRYAKTAKDYLRARGINDVVLIGSGFSTFGKALPYVAMLNLSNENMDLIGIGRQAFVDPDLLHIASCEFKTCALCNRCFHVLLMKYQLPANCIRNGDYRKLFSMLQGGKIEEIGPDLIEFVVRAYLSLKGDSKREMAEFMARYGDAFNEIFLKRLQNNPADADALFYFDQTRDLEVFYKVQQLRNTIEVGLRPLYDNVLRNIQAGIAISPSQPENTTAVGWTEKHRLDDTYREFVLPLASQISREHNVRLTQYAAADGTTSVDLDNLLQEAKIDAAIFSTDIVINCHIVQDSEDRSLIGIFDDYGHLLQIKYKGRCYLPAVPAERVKHRVGQLNTFTNETQCNELVSRLTAQFNTASKNTFSRSVIIDNTRISFAQRDIFATDYEEAADIVTVLNLFQNFSITSIRSAMVSLGRKMRDGAYIIAGKVSQHYNYNEVSVWQKRGDKLVLLKGNYLVNMSEIDLSNNDNPPSSASPLPTKPPSPDAERVQQAFNRLNAEARKESQLSASVSKLRGTSQNIMEVNKFRFCLPIEVLRNSPDIALALNSTGLLKQRPQDAENIEFELVVTGVMEEDVKLIEGLNRDDIKKALNLPQKFTVSAITEAQIHETAQRFGYDASNPKNRVTIVKDFFSGALAKGDYMAIATDALDTTEKADTLKEELERELKAELAQENISIRVLVRPESGKSMYSLSKIINDWLEAINQGNLSTISRILPIPAPLTPELEKAIRTAWAVLTAA